MKRIIIWIIIILAAAGVVTYFVLRAKVKPVVPTVTAKRGSVTEEVKVTGTTKPVESVELSFERTGKVIRVYAGVGDRVRAGELLVELDKGDLIAQQTQAQATVEQYEAQLEQLRKGTRPEEIQIAQVQVDNAKVTQDDAHRALMDAINDAYSKSDDAARAKTDQLFIDPKTNPVLKFSLFDQQLKTDVGNEKSQIERDLDNWQKDILTIPVSGDPVDYVTRAKTHLDGVKHYLDMVAAALNSAIPTTDTSQIIIDGWMSDVSAARLTITGAITSLQAAYSNYRSSVSALTLAENQLALKQAGPTAEQIAAQEAIVRQAQARVLQVQSELTKTILRSPINGVITRQDAKLGQIVTVSTMSSANVGLVSIISDSKLEIEANVPEVDIGRVAKLNPVVITFDALKGTTYTGTVAKIDPAPTIVEGVVNYRVVVNFTDHEQVKSGLTANLSIRTASKDNVIVLPQYAVVEDDRGSFVRVPTVDGFREDPVTVGLRGSDGMLEIVTGVAEGEVVLNIGYRAP